MEPVSKETNISKRAEEMRLQFTYNLRKALLRDDNYDKACHHLGNLLQAYYFKGVKDGKELMKKHRSTVAKEEDAKRQERVREFGEQIKEKYDTLSDEITQATAEKMIEVLVKFIKN